MSKLELVARQDVDQSMTKRIFEVRASDVPGFSSYVVLKSEGSTGFPHQGTWTQNVSNNNTYRYIAVVKTVNEYLWISELRVFN